MADAPAPPFTIDLSEQARDDLSRTQGATAAANAVILRAANRLRRELEMGQNMAYDVHGKKEQLTVRVSLVPPETVRIEGITPGEIIPDGAIEV